MMRFFLPQQETFRKDIIKKGPPTLRIVFETKKQEESLPKRFKIYDTNGNDCKLYFETDGIFIKYKTKENEKKKGTSNITNERIFYNEINNFKFVPTEGFEKCYTNLVLHTKFGKRVLYFIPREYTKIISDIFLYE
ncbi:hypothetical protein M9Y10_009706 [Tritrichomonas musculus]|uniref:UBFD1 PH-like C-terminal domain-containing protein n=1 Tax=Tritrichomonas musculus TaxID=1915356 RepID=A0ABR2IQV4_9EUKA